MPTALEQLPLTESRARVQRCQQRLKERLPEVAGLLITSQLNIYYFSGTLGLGLLWLPVEGEPVLLIRKGLERALLESPLAAIRRFHSFRDIAGLCAEAGSPLPERGSVGVEAAHMTLAQARMLEARVPGLNFVPADAVITRIRAVKSEWELNKLRLAGERHARCLTEILPARIKPGMTERDIALQALNSFYEAGHGGMVRLSGGGVSAGYASVGESGLYATNFDGPLGARGLHPATPYLGDAGTVWKKGQVLTVDMGFALEGYNTDKTQTYWAGPAPVSDEVRRAHDCCVDIQQRAAAMLKPGVLPSQIWAEAQNWAAKAGYADNFMGYGPERVRFLGHGIGLNMDEFPPLAKGFDEPLEAGMVIALEPKLGLPGIGMPGVENTFEITEQGARSLTGDRFELIVVE